MIDAYKTLNLSQRGLLLILFGRLAAIILFLCTFYFASKNFNIDQKNNVQVLLALSSLFCITIYQGYLIKSNCNCNLNGFFQLSLDVVLLTYAMGLIDSVNSFAIYIVLIICASLLLDTFSAVLLAALCGLCYGFLVINAPATNLSSSLEIIIAYSTLVFAGLIGTFYNRHLDGLKTYISKQKNEIEKISQDHIRLIDSFTEGIITLDLDSAITGINQAAKTILGLAENAESLAIGKPIDDALLNTGLIDTNVLTKLKLGETTEIQANINNIKTTLKCTLQSIRNESGHYNGNVMFISDIGEYKNIEDRLEMHENMARLVSSYASSDYSKISTIPGIVGESPILKELMLVIQQASPTNAPILILGESGTGKELVAKAVHSLSPRADKPFVAVNCGAIPENLLESELFGHKKGSFTGADRETFGLFREANGGTLFLDEIGEMPIHLQAKLLRVLQEGVVRPVGSSKEVSVDVRIIAATNKNLKELVVKKEFREDLFYRLRVIELVLPPLRLRKGDIPALVFYFLKNAGIDITQVKISPEAWELLVRYDYPGNIRELENIIQRARVLGNGAIVPETLPEDIRLFKQKFNSIDVCESGSNLPINLDSHLEKIEKKFLVEALLETGGVKKEAARALGMNFRSFRYRLKKYNLCDEEEDDPQDISIKSV